MKAGDLASSGLGALAVAGKWQEKEGRLDAGVLRKVPYRAVSRDRERLLGGENVEMGYAGCASAIRGIRIAGAGIIYI